MHPTLTATPRPRPGHSPHPAGVPRQTMIARFQTLMTERHGFPAPVPLDATSQIAAEDGDPR